MLTLDIETYKDISDEGYVAWKSSNIQAPSNYKDPEKIAASIAEQKRDLQSKFALSPLTGKIILIGCLTDVNPDKDVVKYSIVKYSIDGKDVWYVPLEGDEIEILTNFWKLFHFQQLKDGGDICTYNGKAFDLPFILHRSTILNIKLPIKISMQKYLNKYQHTPHLDIFNWFGSGSLVEWSYRLGIGNSLQRDGDKIGSWYEDGQMQQIKDKNMIDLAQTYSIYQRIKDWL
jgi:DNA polymerase elongation subunit (family B)